MLVPLDHPGVEIRGIWTMGDERTNEVFIDNVFVPDEFVVGQVNSGFQYISQALDLERFTMFTFSPIKQRLDLLTDYVRTEHPRRRAAQGRPGRAVAAWPELHTDAEVARVMGLKVVAESVKGEHETKATGEPAAADGRVLRVQAVRHRVLEAAGRRVDGHRRARHASCGCTPRTRR